MADRKDRMALLSRYSKLHTMKYEEKPLLNLNTDQWAADNLIESYGMSLCYDALEYYFEVAHSPTWKYFANNMDKVIDSKRKIEEDYRERAEMRKRARAWVNE
jgi:hypothetical protein